MSINQWFKRQGKKTCPHCRAAGKGFHYVINKGLRSEINQLKIKCSNHKKGCEWTGELGELKAHLESEKGCGFVTIDCPNKCMQPGVNFPLIQPKKKMMRKDLDKHLNSECPLRPYQCEYCGLKDTYEKITGRPTVGNTQSGVYTGYVPEVYTFVASTHASGAYPSPFGYTSSFYSPSISASIHDECPEYLSPLFGYPYSFYSPSISAPTHYDECPEYPLACLNGYGVKDIKRKDMKNHRSKCPQEPVECPFIEAGCPNCNLHRHELDDHLNSYQQKHLLLVMGAYKQVKDKL